MKTVSIVMLALVGTLILNLPMQSYADPQLDTLLRIATQARDNLSINLSQLTNIPSEISDLYKKGSDETGALKQAVQQQDINSAKQHFLSAMQFFKITNDKINSLNATALNDQKRTQILTLQDEIISIEKTGQRLRDIATTNNVDANFTEFDKLIQQAKQDLANNDVNATAVDIQNVNQVVSDIHHYLATVAQQRTSDRAKDFTEKQIEKLSNESVSTTSNETSQASINSSTVNTNATTQESPQEMVAKLRTLISQGKIDEAIQELKILQAHQKNELENRSNESSIHQNSDNSSSELNQSNDNSTINFVPDTTNSTIDNTRINSDNSSSELNQSNDNSTINSTKTLGNENNPDKHKNESNPAKHKNENTHQSLSPSVTTNSTSDSQKFTHNVHVKNNSEKRIKKTNQNKED
ncbi:MAG: hypothetical protein ABI340_03095 [Nitrososphaera sp.]